MEHPIRLGLKTGSGASLAFAIVVLASYFAMFSASKENISLAEIALMMFLGIAYIGAGVYGYSLCARKKASLYKLVYFLIQIPLGSLIVYLGKGAGFNALLLLPLVGHGVMLLPQTTSFFTSGFITLAYIISVRLFSPGWEMVWSGLPTFLAGVIFITIFTDMMVKEEQARSQVERLVDDLEEANARLRGYAIQADELATYRERNRLAREIHDGLGHYLTAIHMQIQAVRAIMVANPKQANEMLAASQKLTQDALMDVRQSVASLRDSANGDRPLPEMISHLVEDCHPAGVESHFIVTGHPRPLSPQAQLTLFRAAQEGLNNIHKHAHASRTEIVLDYTSPSQVHLSVQDDGAGADHFDGGFGLLGLQERAHLLKGEVRTTSTKGKGFRLDVLLPG